ncbi:alpha-amylase [Treponema parvum]|uniref:Alpha-amylase n=1 Tax=Treponema parvum TaxID=138851 RepID=A0A975IE00_9SPIR|nr:alpha-amylase family glycosyl hydrolase [Treponema parvum]QTQ12749.1 alpha-amylase [Treponema parvum]
MKKDLPVSYNEFHVSKTVRDMCGFADTLFSSSGNVVFRNIRAVRLFAQKLNALFDAQKTPELKISAGNLNAMGLIDEIFHIVSMIYRRDKYRAAFFEALEALDKKFGKEKVDGMLLCFVENFPSTEVYAKKIFVRDFLNKKAFDQGVRAERENRESVLEELILLYLANENPAFKPFKILFDDSPLKELSIYKDAWTEIKAFFKAKPVFGPFSHDLITMLREPVIFSPNDLRGQLEYIKKHWVPFFPELAEIVSLLLSSLDLLSEEAKAAWRAPNAGGALPDMSAYSYENLMNEYERFSPDREWMPKVVLMAKSVLVWLDQLGKKYNRSITRLDQIPDEEINILADEGFTGLWLIGLWERSSASRRIKQLCGNPEAAASAYSLYDYDIAANIGGWDAINDLRFRLWKRGIRLASDMVPNHTGMDSRWISEKPDLFIQRKDNPFPQYTFNGEDLSHDPRIGIYLEDHYYNRSDCAVVFKRVDKATGDVRYIYHGNDGTGMPWNDTAQIDFLNPAAREEIIQKILHVARNFPIIRFDAAMVLAKKHIRRLWYPEPGRGGDIATRSETQLSTKQFEDAIPQEFWREVVDRVAKEVPDTLLLAEAFWMMEGYFVRTLGMHRVYNSAFMNMLKKEENQKYRDTVKNTLAFDPQVLKRFVNFMNNPDEETAVAQFGKGDKYFGVCTLMVTMPGLPLFGHGQIEGFEEKYGMEYTRAYKYEVPDEGLIERHRKVIFPLMKKRYLFAQIDDFLFFDVWNGSFVNENVFAYSNRCGDEKAVVFYNNKYERAFGTIKQSVPYAVNTGGEGEVQMRSRSIGEGLGLSSEQGRYCIFRDLSSGLWYVRESSDIYRNGLFVSLNGFETQVLLDIREVADAADGKWGILCSNLAGKGVPDLEIAWQELAYKELYEALGAFMSAEFIRSVNGILYPADIPPETESGSAVRMHGGADTAGAAAEGKNSAYADAAENDSAVRAAVGGRTDSAGAAAALKSLNSILGKVKPYALVFYSSAAEFYAKEKTSADNENLKPVGAAKMMSAVKTADSAKPVGSVKPASFMPEKEFRTFSKKAEILVNLAQKSRNLKSSENDALSKFAAENPLSLNALFCLAATGSFAKTSAALKWALPRKFCAFFADAGITAPGLYKDLETMFILGGFTPFKKQKLKNEVSKSLIKKDAYSVAKFMMKSEFSAALCGVNEFGGVLWFNKEASERSLNLFAALNMFELEASVRGDSLAEKQSAVLKMHKMLSDAQKKSEYKVERFLKEFEPNGKPLKTVKEKSAKAVKAPAE